MDSASSPNRPRKVTLTGEGINPASGPYSHVAIAGGFAYVSGQGAREPKTGSMPAGGITAQTDQTMRNILSILNAIGLDISDVVKVNVYLKDIKDFKEFNEAYGRHFAGVPPPARTTVQAVLPRDEMLVEVEVTAKTRT